MTITSDSLKAQRILKALREKLRTTKMASEAKNSAEVYYKEHAQDSLADLIEVDGLNGTGVRFEHGGKELAAIACQADAGKYWDGEPLIAWLRENGYWRSVSTTSLDPKKLEAELSAGNISREAVSKFQVTGAPPKPYVKFINPKPDSK